MPTPHMPGIEERRKGRARGKPGRRGGGKAPYFQWSDFGTADLAAAAERIQKGLPGAAIQELQERLGVSSERLGDVLSIPPRTLTRRKAEARLPRDESERVYRVARLAAIAAEVLGGVDAARRWLKEPNYALGERVPLEVASTEPGAQLVERLLRRIEHGIPV